MKRLNKIWYRKDILSYCLLPFSWVYLCVISIRRFFYRKHIFKVARFAVPVVVVGNITVGGAGKTPLVIALVNELKRQGYKPGVVSRGYGGKAEYYPLRVTVESDPAESGDEPVLIARQTSCPIYVAPDRAVAVEMLLKENDCNIVISDDGLQHYALGRNIEIAVIDGEQRLGNQFCLPAGPLREPVSRLKAVDFKICNGLQAQADEYVMELMPGNFCQVNNANVTQSADYFKNKKIHAVAGIGNPQRFFNLLRKMGLEIIEHPFPDHYLFQASDFKLIEHNIVIMTEKDAVKCTAFANEHYWYLPVQAKLSDNFIKDFFACLNA